MYILLIMSNEIITSLSGIGGEIGNVNMHILLCLSLKYLEKSFTVMAEGGW